MIILACVEVLRSFLGDLGRNPNQKMLLEGEVYCGHSQMHLLMLKSAEGSWSCAW